MTKKKKKKTKKRYTITASYNERQKAKGLALVCLWVPVNKKPILVAKAKALRVEG